MDSLDGYVADDELAVEPLARLGFTVDTLSWRDTTFDWNDYEAVIIRTPWDYQRSPDEFLNVLETINGSPARLENSLDIVRWNLDKRYLLDMEQRGCRIVPTIWDAAYSAAEFDRWLEQFDAQELIIKPTVSATAEHTYRLKTYDSSLEGVFASRSFMVQPFMPNIVAEGEYSLFFFNGEYSHTINKSPKTADFRVQEEHGGIITEVAPDEKLRVAAQNALDKIGEPLLYARVDLVRDERGEFSLMELELIEPALYLRMSDGAPERFAAAIETLLK
jgi:hypothetical protein